MCAKVIAFSSTMGMASGAEGLPCYEQSHFRFFLVETWCVSARLSAWSRFFFLRSPDRSRVPDEICPDKALLLCKNVPGSATGPLRLCDRHWQERSRRPI